MPTNNVIIAMDQKADLTPAEEQGVDYYLAHWNKLHRGRYVQYIVSYTAGLFALLSVGRW
jgi:hypothetical protein